jgi:hypothetical protein
MPAGYGPCGTALAEEYRSIGGKVALRPACTYSIVDVGAAAARLWEDHRFAAMVLHHDVRRASSFRHSEQFTDIKRDHPALADHPGTLFASLYLDFFNFFDKPGSATKAQIGALVVVFFFFFCIMLAGF